MHDRTCALPSTESTPALTMSPADIAAHAAGSYVRPPRITHTAAGFGICGFCGKPDVAGHACNSVTPDMDAVLTRVTTRVAYLLRDRQTTDAARRELAGTA